ncbi:MAG: glycosyltransferase [Sedimentisphaerales bacterium]|nr:glycosyltransferase [Sedimentisphaerales bacterium]
MDTQQQQGKDNDTLVKNRIVVAVLRKTDAGTATSTINEVLAALDRDRFKVLFLFLGSRGPVRREFAEADQVFHLSESAATGLQALPTLIRLARVLRTQQVDLLHCHNPKANTYGVLAAIMARTPAVLVQFHGLKRTRGIRRKLANLLIFRRAAAIVAVADAVRKDIVASNWHVPHDRFRLLESSIDFARFAHTDATRSAALRQLGVPADAVVLGTIGRLAPTKGLSYLLEAFGAVRQQVASAHLVLLGDGPSRTELEQQVTRTPYRDAVHFLGHRSNVAQLLQGFDVFVLASVAEGMPRVILEAMAAGVPCVSTAVGGIPEMLDGGRLGSLVPPRDVGQLADALLKMATLPEQDRQDLINHARCHVQTRYSHEVIGAKLAALYEQAYARCVKE